MESTLAADKFPGFENVYDLGDPLGREFRGKISLSVPDARAATRADLRPGRVQVHWAMGRRTPGDLIRTTSGAPLLVSDRVVELLKAGGYSGWSTYPVEVFGKDRLRIPGYHGLAVHGRCGAIEDDRSVKVDRQFPAGVFPMWKGLYFAPATWDGSDVFMPRGSDWIFVVAPVKQSLESAKVSNLECQRLVDVERMLLIDG